MEKGSSDPLADGSKGVAVIVVDTRAPVSRLKILLSETLAESSGVEMPPGEMRLFFPGDLSLSLSLSPSLCLSLSLSLSHIHKRLYTRTRTRARTHTHKRVRSVAGLCARDLASDPSLSLSLSLSLPPSLSRPSPAPLAGGSEIKDTSQSVTQLGICSGEVLTFERGQPLLPHQFSLRVIKLRKQDVSLGEA